MAVIGKPKATQQSVPPRPQRPPEPDWDVIKRVFHEFLCLERWVNWRFELRGGRYSKVPCQPDGSAASSTNARTWSKFEHCEIAYETRGFDGIGIVLNGDGLVAWDFDHCLDETLRITDPRIAAFVRTLGGYCELSPSLTGVHIFILGKLPSDGRRTGPVEAYATSRYLTLTGLAYAY